jgi:hypothetical protein
MIEKYFQENYVEDLTLKKLEIFENSELLKKKQVVEELEELKLFWRDKDLLLKNKYLP